MDRGFRCVANKAPMVWAKLGIGIAPRAQLPVTEATRLEMVLRLLLPPGRERFMEEPPRVRVVRVLEHL